MQISVLKDRQIANILESSDSGAWKFESKKGNWKPVTYEQKIKNYISYSLKIQEQIIDDYRYRNLAMAV
jgi:hypothetical protein